MATSKKGDPLKKAVDAALTLAADTPWDSITLVQIADKAGLSLSDFYDEIDKATIADAIERRFDLAASAEAVDETDTPRERLFDVTMLRIEAMEAHRDAMLSIRAAARRSPSARLALARQRFRTAKWLLTCARLDEVGLDARAVGFARILARTESAWRKDVDADFARTMATLDRELRDAEAWLKRIRGFVRGRSNDKAEGSADTSGPDGSPAPDGAH